MTKFDILAPQWMTSLMEAFGLADFQAAGILGNLGFESGGFEQLQELDPLIPGSRGGLGVAQWTAVRRQHFERMCAVEGMDPLSDEANYDFLMYELQGDYGSTVKALLSCKTLESAVFSVGQTYERPAGTTRTHLPGYESRLAWGKRALSVARSLNMPPPDVIHPVLRAGSEGVAVKELQRRLKGLGYAVGPVDGDYGRRTDAAVCAFQAARQIKVDGICGPVTWNQLAHAERERSTLP